MKTQPMPLATAALLAEPSAPPPETLSTQEAARLLGLAVRSVQLMVDRGELHAWRTPGGHRRIAAASVQQWLNRRHGGAGRPLGASEPQRLPSVVPQAAAERGGHRHRVLLIEDSAHAINMVRLLMEQHFPEVDLHVAHNGIAGLITAGQIEPCVLLVDILLPGIDGATLVAGLRAHPAFAQREVIILTGLSPEQQQPYAFALRGLPVIAKTQMVSELPAGLGRSLEKCNKAATN